MIRVLHIESGSEAETYFMKLIEETESKIAKVAHSEMYDGVLCNRYEIDENTYESIKAYLIKARDEG